MVVPIGLGPKAILPLLAISLIGTLVSDGLLEESGKLGF